MTRTPIVDYTLVCIIGIILTYIQSMLTLALALLKHRFIATYNWSGIIHRYLVWLNMSFLGLMVWLLSIYL